MSTFDTLFPTPTGGRNADDMGMPPNWPPRLTFTPEGIAGLFLRKHFATANGEHQQELAGLLRECVEQDRKRCAQWVRDNYQDHATIASLCDAMVALGPNVRAKAAHTAPPA